MVFKTPPHPPSTQSNNHIALDLDAKRILANEFSSPRPVRLLFVDLRQRESYRNNSVKTNRRTCSHIYRAFPQSNATQRHVQYAKMRVLRLGHNCTRQNGAVRLSPARIKATNMFSFLFHQEASPCCLPVCVCACVYVSNWKLLSCRLNLVRKEVFTVALYMLFIHMIFSYDAAFNPSHRRRLQWLLGVWREKEIIYSSSGRSFDLKGCA